MFDTLIDLKVLADRPSGWCVVDCRASLADLDYGRRAYAAGHIPGAVFADLAEDLSGPIVAGVTGRHPLPERDALARTFGRLGIAAGTQVVAYDADNGAFAARLWWLLRWLGHAAVAVLDGGLAAWTTAGLALAKGVEQRSPCTFPSREPLTDCASTRDIATNHGRYLLVDARAEARYRGAVEPIDRVAGHIPGAVCMPFEGNLDGSGRFLAAAQLRARFDRLDTTSRELVCYCGSGVTACHNILAMRHAGLPEAKLYPGSFSEWIADGTRPVAQEGSSGA